MKCLSAVCSESHRQQLVAFNYYRFKLHSQSDQLCCFILLMTSASQATVQLISRAPLSRSAALPVHVQALNTGDAAHRSLLSLYWVTDCQTKSAIFVMSLWLLTHVGCGINNRTSSIIGRPISTATLSLRSIRGTLIGQRYLRGCTALDPDRPFRWRVIAKNTKFWK